MAAKVRPPAPPPPVRKKRLRQRGGSGRAVSGGTAAEIASAAQIGRKKAAAFRALQLFLEDPDVSLADVWRHGRVSIELDAPLICEWIEQQDLYTASRTEGWLKRKAEFWRAIQDRVLADAQSKIIDREMGEINDLERVQKRAMLSVVGGTDATGKKVEPAPVRSFEGAVRALVTVDQRLGEKRRGVAQTLAQAATGRAQGLTLVQHNAGPVRTVPQVEDGLSEDDVLEMARALARKRAGVVEAPATALPALPGPTNGKGNA